MNDLQLTVTTTKQKTNGSTFDKVNVNMLLKLYRSLDNALITAFIRLIINHNIIIRSSKPGVGGKINRVQTKKQGEN